MMDVVTLSQYYKVSIYNKSTSWYVVVKPQPNLTTGNVSGDQSLETKTPQDESPDRDRHRTPGVASVQGPSDNRDVFLEDQQVVDITDVCLSEKIQDLFTQGTDISLADLSSAQNTENCLTLIQTHEDNVTSEVKVQKEVERSTTLTEQPSSPKKQRGSSSGPTTTSEVKEEVMDHPVCNNVNSTTSEGISTEDQTMSRCSSESLCKTRKRSRPTQGTRRIANRAAALTRKARSAIGSSEMVSQKAGVGDAEKSSGAFDTYRSGRSGKPSRKLFSLTKNSSTNNIHQRLKIIYILVQCSHCDNAFLSRSRMGAPFTDEFLQKGVHIHCTACQKVGMSSCTVVDDHKKHVDLLDATFVCREGSCQKTFATLGTFGQHKLRHLDDPCVCSECGRLFQNKWKLAGHMEAVHRDKTKDKMCELCGKFFKNANELQRHLNTVHGPKVTHSCEICGKTTSTAYTLKIHMSTHRRKVYPCPVCGKEFQSRTGRLGHHKSHIENFKCEICNKNFSTKDGFIRHKVVHDHENRTKYKCSVCSRVFISKLGYSQHLTKHQADNQILNTSNTDTTN